MRLADVLGVQIKFRTSQQGGQTGVLEQILAQEPNIIEGLFANLPQLAAFNTRFLADIKAAQRSQGSVAGALEQSIPNLRIYSTFISNYDRSMALLKRIEEDPRAHAFLSACELQKGCGGLDLRSLLIQPVQRIPRYRLLLSEILKYTTRDDPERPKLQRALDLVMQVAASINDNIAKGTACGVDECWLSALAFLTLPGEQKRADDDCWKCRRCTAMHSSRDPRDM
jgi:hypothetical protein